MPEIAPKEEVTYDSLPEYKQDPILPVQPKKHESSQTQKVKQDSYKVSIQKPNPKHLMNFSNKTESKELSEDIVEVKNAYNTFLKVAKDGDKVVGMIRAIDKGNFIYLHQMYITPEYHRQGIGSLLMQTIPKDKRIVCAVFSYNIQAINFYKKHGFSRVDKPEGKFMINGKLIATVIYERIAI